MTSLEAFIFLAVIVAGLVAVYLDPDDWSAP